MYRIIFLRFETPWSTRDIAPVSRRGGFFLGKGNKTKASAVVNFFVPIFSKNEKEKEEDILVYNFHQLTKKIERMCIISLKKMINKNV